MKFKIVDNGIPTYTNCPMTFNLSLLEKVRGARLVGKSYKIEALKAIY